MIRFLILFGFAYLFLHLHLTGDISKYINMRYGYLSFLMIFIIGFMAVYQLVKWNKEGSKQHHTSEKRFSVMTTVMKTTPGGRKRSPMCLLFSPF
ncbi:DUF1980 domain-containing protein [Sporolactobacillus inulinus]|uniref:DUF1980 domain-containing protein n=1 Tax=Sporolactobacillus inulinus TaxID=2078 RepID=A0A4Y1ZCU5_9BACL|nr:DUF1980 domain-containing protein [Sporolactobacillus inulinus]